MSEGPKLITDPQTAKAMTEAAKIDMSEPATKQDVADYVRNYFNANIRGIIQQQNMIANGLNLLMDFLSQRGVVGVQSQGGKRGYLRTDEFNEYVQMRQKAAEQAAKTPAPKAN